MTTETYSKDELLEIVKKTEVTLTDAMDWVAGLKHLIVSGTFICEDDEFEGIEADEQQVVAAAKNRGKVTKRC